MAGFGSQAMERPAERASGGTGDGEETRLPRKEREKERHHLEVLEAAERLLGKKSFGEITVQEIAAEAEIPVKALDEILLAVRTSAFLSLDDTGPAPQGNTALRDALAEAQEGDPSTRVERSELLDLLQRALVRLPETERKVVFLYYNQNLLLREIGAVLEVSESRVSQILSRAHFLLNKEIKSMGG